MYISVIAGSAALFHDRDTIHAEKGVQKCAISA